MLELRVNHARTTSANSPANYATRPSDFLWTASFTDPAAQGQKLLSFWVLLVVGAGTIERLRSSPHYVNTERGYERD